MGLRTHGIESSFVLKKNISTMERKTIYLCLARMSEAGLEQKYVK